jgi:uncharacterized membrane protein
LVGSAHQDYRLQKVLPAQFYEQTSILPFKAIWEGRNSLQKAAEEFSLQTAAIAVTLGAFFKFRNSFFYRQPPKVK